MPASDQHKLYIKNKDKWKLVRDCVAGSAAIKAARRTESNDQGGLYNMPGSIYLPVPNPSDNSKQNEDRYTSYRMRACFINFTGYTKDGLLGMIARKPTEVILQPVIDYAVLNIDGAGLSLQGMSQEVINDLLETGCYGLLEDFPKSEGGSQEQTRALQSVTKGYPAESIINWRYTVIDSVKVLTMVALAEEVEKISSDGFSVEDCTYTRVLLLDADGNYLQQLYNEDDELLVNREGESDIYIKKSDGSNWKEIPFQFVGAENNDSTPDKSPLYDVAEVNIGHYRNSADFEDSSFLVGQPTPVFSGLTESWVKSMMKDGIQIGSRAGIMLPVDSSASLLQADANTMPAMGMDRKEAELVKIGAKIISDQGGIETAEAAKKNKPQSDGNFEEEAKKGADAANHIDMTSVCVDTTTDADGLLCPGPNKQAWVIKLDPNEPKRFRKVSAPPTIYKGNVFYPIYEPPPEENKCNIGKAFICSADDECGTNNSSELGDITGEDCLFVRRGILSELTIFADTLYGNIAGPAEQEDTLYILSTNAGEVTTYRRSWRENY